MGDETRASSSFAVVIINYNTREHLRACLASVQGDTPGEVVVVDNASSDGSAEMVRAEYPWVSLYANTANTGYGAAANQAIHNCTAPYVLLLNSDTLLQPGTLRALSAYFKYYPQAAVVGPRIVNPDGTLQVSCFPFPTPLHTLFRESVFSVLIGRIPVLRDWYLPTSSHNHAQSVPWVLGAALAMRRTAFEAVGGFDESFFMYFEETDLCYRLHEAGWEIHFTPDATIIHVGAASTEQRRADMAVQLYASLYHFYQKHYSCRAIRQLNAIVTYVMLRNIIRDTLRLCRSQDPYQRSRLFEDVIASRRVLTELRSRWATHE